MTKTEKAKQSFKNQLESFYNLKADGYGNYKLMDDVREKEYRIKIGKINYRFEACLGKQAGWVRLFSGKFNDEISKPLAHYLNICSSK